MTILEALKSALKGSETLDLLIFTMVTDGFYNYHSNITTNIHDALEFIKEYGHDPSQIQNIEFNCYDGPKKSYEVTNEAGYKTMHVSLPLALIINFIEMEQRYRAGIISQ